MHGGHHVRKIRGGGGKASVFHPKQFATRVALALGKHGVMQSHSVFAVVFESGFGNHRCTEPRFRKRNAGGNLFALQRCGKVQSFPLRYPFQHSGVTVCENERF